VRIAGWTAARAKRFSTKAREAFPELAFAARKNAEEAMAGADIICTVASSSTPVLKGVWVTVGAHINAVGSMQEIDEAALLKARVFTDHRPSALAQAREIIEAGPKVEILGEIGEVLAGKVQGRLGASDITLYRSLGTAAQDLICADYVRQKLG